MYLYLCTLIEACFSHRHIRRINGDENKQIDIETGLTFLLMENTCRLSGLTNVCRFLETKYKNELLINVPFEMELCINVHDNDKGRKKTQYEHQKRTEKTVNASPHNRLKSNSI